MYRPASLLALFALLVSSTEGLGVVAFRIGFIERRILEGLIDSISTLSLKLLRSCHNAISQCRRLFVWMLLSLLWSLALVDLLLLLWNMNGPIVILKHVLLSANSDSYFLQAVTTADELTTSCIV